MLNEQDNPSTEDACAENVEPQPESHLGKGEKSEESILEHSEESDKRVSWDAVQHEESNALKYENERLLDEMLRMRAEMENSKKRLQRNFDEKVKDVNKSLLLDIISLLDDFDRALGSNDKTEKITNSSAVLDGVKMISDQFLQVLGNKWGLRQFYAVNIPFNPDEHEALVSEHSDEIDCPMVSEVYMKGYKLYNALLRPAKVKVLQPKSV